MAMLTRVGKNTTRAATATLGFQSTPSSRMRSSVRATTGMLRTARANGITIRSTRGL